MTGIKCEIKVVSRQKMGSETEVTEEVYEGNYLDRGDKKYLSLLLTSSFFIAYYP